MVTCCETNGNKYCELAFPSFILLIYIWAARWQNQQNDCAPSKDSDQPGHPASLIRLFAVRMKKHWDLNYLLSAQWRLIRLGGCPGWSFACRTCHFVGFFVRQLIYLFYFFYSYILAWFSVKIACKYFAIIGPESNLISVIHFHYFLVTCSLPFQKCFS